MMYADYSYYTDSFGGSLIPETDWKRTAGIASSWMDSATFGRLTNGIPDEWENEVRNCCCELSEQVYSFVISSLSDDEDDAKLSSEKIGNYSITYRSDAEFFASFLHGSTAGFEDVAKSIISRYLGRTGLLYRGVYE